MFDISRQSFSISETQKRVIYFTLLIFGLSIVTVQPACCFVLNKAPEGNPGEIGMVEITGPSGIEVAIENVSMGTIQNDGKLILSGIRSGSRELNVYRKGFPNEIYTIEVFPNTTNFVELSAETIYGNLIVNSSPTNVKVYIDNKYSGITPLYISDLLVRGYKLRLEMEGYQKWEQDIVVQPGKTESVSITLTVNEPALSPTTSRTPGFGILISIISVLCLFMWANLIRRKT